MMRRGGERSPSRRHGERSEASQKTEAEVLDCFVGVLLAMTLTWQLPAIQPARRTAGSAR
jgi:hypothetical protein